MTDISLPTDPSRRAFCSLGCLSAAATLATLTAACGGGGSNSTSPGGSGSTGSPLASATGTVNGRTVSVPLEGALATVGGAALVRTAIGNYLVARTGQDTATALTATCTHESNLITNFTGSQFACTFHGSLFTTSGSVARGPATRPLTSFPTTVAGNAVTFTV
ncbi:Rieske 2Fe-2S domain-containing protein [Luteitalea sp. TBR-22]|uniref:Rieske 2Fe-2S domain-containing protein n=1 Tax=Luteitalea sp. TBR-22 TaxID=2802971 RepID=UPI001AF77D8E|nr:Rieske 2Fe-2S domain-containing protein [Luteitalea sp. TBR-22]